MKKLLLSLCVLTIATACKKTVNEQPPEIPGKIAEISLVEPSVVSPVPIQGDPTFNFLGYGYDVTRKVDHASSVTHPVIDMAAFASHKHIEQSLAVSGWADSYDSDNAENLAAQLSNGSDETSGRKLYGETMSSLLPGQNVFDKKYVYGFYSEMQQFKILYFFIDSDIAKDLSPKFMLDEQQLDAETLVKKYGTHILTKIQLGTRFNVIYQAEVGNADRTLAQRAGYNTGLGKIFGLWSGRQDKVDSTALRAVTAPKMAFEAIGGDPSLAKVIKSASGTRVDFPSWRNSVSSKNIVFIRATTLVSLAAVILDPVKKVQVQNYIQSYLAANEVKLQN